MKEPTRVIILSNQTLFVEGVITRLQQHENRVQLHVVDLKQPNLLAKIKEVQPTAIILEDKDPLVPLDRLLRVLPTLKVIRLDTQCLQTQVIRSEQYWVEEVCDLIDLIEPTNGKALDPLCIDCHETPATAIESHVPGADQA